jgi:cytochrome c553
MMKRFLYAACSAATFALAAVPVAADELETKLQSCDGCHGPNGQPIDASIPTIWGQQKNFLVKQLHDYRTEDRANPVMSPIAETVKQEELRKTAEFFAAKTWPAHQAAATPAAAPPAEKITVCRACHQQNFEGGLPAPRLAGQSYQYLVTAMNNFADDKRTNNQDMATLMKALSPGDREAIAHYLAGL